MRGSRIGLVIGAAIMVAVGGGMIWQAQVSTLASGTLRSTGIVLCLGGLAMLFAARWIGRMTAGSVRREGALSGTARILALADTGVTVGSLTAILRADAEISVGGRPPYRASFKLPVGRHQLGSIVPGAVLPVLVDPSDPKRIVVDDAPGPQAQAAMLQAAAAGASAAPVVTRSASEIVAQGERGEAVIVSAQQTGQTAGQMAPGAGLAPDEADDPVAIVQLRIEAIGRAPFEAVSAMRVPDGKHGVLVPGRRVPVAFLPTDPAGTATIDWARA